MWHLYLCSLDRLSADTSPKIQRLGYKKAPAPQPPTFTNQHSALQQPAKMANHQRSHSAHEMAGAVSPCERPSVPPPAPPKRPEKPTVGNKGDLAAGEKTTPADTENRPSGHVVGGLWQANTVASAPVGCGSEAGDGTRSEINFFLGLRTQSANTSGLSEVGDLSWSSESDLSHSAATDAQPKEDRRKINAQKKAEWWHNSPTPSDRATSKLATEISGKYDPRVSPSEPQNESSVDGKPEKKSAENDAELEGVDPMSDDSNERLETADRKSDTVDENNTVDRCTEMDEKLEDVDRLLDNTDGKSFDVCDGETEKFEVEMSVSKVVATALPHTPPTPSPRLSLAEDHNTEDHNAHPAVKESTEEDLEQVHFFDAPSTSVLSAPVTQPKPLRYSDDTEPGSASAESTHGKELFRQVSLPSETSAITTAPPIRPKPLRSPPARPLAVISASEVCSEAGPPPLTRKPSADRKSHDCDSTELPTSPTTPSQSDVPPKTRTADKVRPEKPPPPLPKSLRSQTSETATKSQADVEDSSVDVAVSDEVALHDEDTRL